MCASDEARQRVMAIMEGRLASEPQTSAAKRMYDARASTYDDSWHPSFARDFVQQLPLFPGARVLDLACGTGLLTFLAAERVGPDGAVVGVDISPGMLAVARQKLTAGTAPNRANSTSSDLLIDTAAEEEEEPADPDRWKHVRLFEHSATELDSLDEVAELKGTFDFITVASTLVLLPEPDVAIRGWLSYLKPGGILAVDVAHPQNLIAGIVLERVGRRMGVNVPYHRGWVLDEHSLPDMLATTAGMQIVQNKFMQQVGYGERYLSTDKAEIERQFSSMITSEAGKAFGQNRGPKWEEARIIFYEEWMLEAERSGDPSPGVKEVDGVWLTLARKPPVSGSCRCGEVRYTAGKVPEMSSMCHCRTCQKLSGGPYMAYAAVEADDVTWLEDSERVLRLVKISRTAVRAFCERCGTPVYMRYRVQADGALEEKYWFCLSTVDEGLPDDFKINMRIFLDEKAKWEVLPEDGVERWRTERSDGEVWVEGK